MLKEESSQHESQDFLDEAVFWAEATWGKGKYCPGYTQKQMTICLQFGDNLSTICLQFVSVFSWFCLSFVTTKTKQNKDKLQIVYKNKTKQRQMTNCLQIVDNLSFVFVLFCFCCDKIQTKPRKN